MTCTILWRTYTRVQWSKLLALCPHSTLLQSYYYAQAMREVHKQGVRHALIQIDGKDAGIVQIQEVALFSRMIHGFSIDRGPLWFKGFGKVEHLKAFATALDIEFPSQWGRKRRFMPEYIFKNTVLTLDNWNKIQKSSIYHSNIVNLSDNLDDIRQNLRKNWRNSLSKAEKQGLNVEMDTELSTLGHFLQFYLKDRLEKRYAGASPKFLASLCKFAAMEGECLILNATEDDEIIASTLIFIHGTGATYQAGWTTPYGRDKSAHQLLLWRAVEVLKSRGVIEFDLGGFNNDTESLKQFKQGMGGHDIALIGSYS